MSQTFFVWLMCFRNIFKYMQYKISFKQSLLAGGSVGTVLFLAFLLFFSFNLSGLSSYPKADALSGTQNPLKESFHANIINDTKANEFYRRVLFTGLNSQLVIMSIPPGGEVGKEIHKYTEQTLFFLSGTGEGEFDGKKFPIIPGDVVVVVPGTEHNFINTGSQALKIYTVYAPPNHIDGRIHLTKADSDADLIDEAVGESAPVK